MPVLLTVAALTAIALGILSWGWGAPPPEPAIFSQPGPSLFLAPTEELGAEPTATPTPTATPAPTATPTPTSTPKKPTPAPAAAVVPTPTSTCPPASGDSRRTTKKRRGAVDACRDAELTTKKSRGGSSGRSSAEGLPDSALRVGLLAWVQGTLTEGLAIGMPDVQRTVTLALDTALDEAAGRDVLRQVYRLVLGVGAQE